MPYKDKAQQAAWGREWKRNNRPHLARKQKEYYDKNPERYLYILAKSRAKAKGIPFTIALADVVIPDVCPALGIPLERGARGKCDGAPSIDRVDNSLGYIPGNVRVISRRANSIKRDATSAELAAVIAYVEEQESRA